MTELESLLRPQTQSARGPFGGAPERRDRDRVQIRLLLNELVGERLHRAMTTNVSATGLFVDRMFGAGLERLQLGREERQVQLEFTLPETSETIWALADVRFDEVGAVRDRLAVVHGTGMQFSAMADKHRRLLRDFVYEHRRKGLVGLLDRIRNRRRADRRRTERRGV